MLLSLLLLTLSLGHIHSQDPNHITAYTLNSKKARVWPKGWPASLAPSSSAPKESAHCRQNIFSIKTEKEGLATHLPLNTTLSPHCFHSQVMEDIFLLKHFGDSLFARGGEKYFLEMGGYDGVTHSNTYFAEALFGWKGVLIEPDPENFRKLLMYRPHVIAFNEIVCDKGDVEFYIGGGTGGAKELFDPKFFARWHKNKQRRKVALKCVSLSALLAVVLERSGVFCYDFFSLDVEGAELSVMATLDLTRFRFRVIVVEEDGDNIEKEAAVAAILQRHGYVKYAMTEDTRNGWYVMYDTASGCHV